MRVVLAFPERERWPAGSGETERPLWPSLVEPGEPRRVTVPAGELGAELGEQRPAGAGKPRRAGGSG
jgi:hypothetical protein